jgi:hypothetical protein
MKNVVTIVPVQEAYDDFLRRTLGKISCALARLIYLASMRDCNTGRYRHDGLAARFSAETAGEALEMAHREIFYAVAALPLCELVQQMQTYFESSHESQAELLRAWRRLEPYRIAVPLGVNTTAAALFISNVKLALVILPRSRQQVQAHPSVS